MLELRAVDGAADERHADGGKGMRVLYADIRPATGSPLHDETTLVSFSETRFSYVMNTETIAPQAKSGS